MLYCIDVVDIIRQQQNIYTTANIRQKLDSVRWNIRVAYLNISAKLIFEYVSECVFTLLLLSSSNEYMILIWPFLNYKGCTTIALTCWWYYFPMIGSASVTGDLLITIPSSMLLRSWWFVIFSITVTRRGVSSLKARTIFTISPFLSSITWLNQHSNIKSDCYCDLGVSSDGCDIPCHYRDSESFLKVIININIQNPPLQR